MKNILEMYPFEYDEEETPELIKKRKQIEICVKNNEMAFRYYTPQALKSDYERKNLIKEMLEKLRNLNKYDRSQLKLTKKKLDIIRLDELNQINREKW